MKYSFKHATELAQDRYALKATSYLSLGATQLPYDISERLRAARAQAVAARKLAPVSRVVPAFQQAGAEVLMGGPEERMGWWERIATALPLLALVVGLLAINSIQNDNRAQELADVDAALLTDELPPAAFSDPGFVQFLKSTR